MNRRMTYFGGLMALGASFLAVFQGIRAGGLDSPECLVLLGLYFGLLGCFFLVHQTNQSAKMPALRSPIAGLSVGGFRHLIDGCNDRNGIPIQPEIPSISEADLAAFLQLPPSEQGRVLGTLRGQATIGQIKPQYRNKALAGMVREKLENLESNPAAFADFQSSFIKEAIGLNDEGKVWQIREIIEKTYKQAVTQGLDAAARPTQGVESWALRRDAIDRPATRQVEGVLSPDERLRFGRLFLGVMGIDLGRGDGARHRFVSSEGGVVFPSEWP
jgi:hypothetical protein